MMRACSKIGGNAVRQHHDRIVTLPCKRSITSPSLSRPLFRNTTLQKSLPNPQRRLENLNRHFATTTSLKKEYNMASNDSRVQNNQDFKLSELFNVKDKVALVRPLPLMHTLTSSSLTFLSRSPAVAPA